MEALLFFLFLDTEASHHFVVPVLIFVLGRGVEISCELMMKAPLFCHLNPFPGSATITDVCGMLLTDWKKK